MTPDLFQASVNAIPFFLITFDSVHLCFLEVDPVFLDTGLVDNQMTQEDRNMAKDEDGDQVKGEVGPAGTEAVGRPESPLGREM